jgi:5-methylthioadenosine/S-adenosylhomocysteine deaminase
MELILTNCTALTADANDTVLQNAEIHIKNGQIAYIGEAAKAPKALAARTVDLHGAVAMPGLVNTHTHLPMTLFRGAADDLPLMRWLNERIWPMEDKLTGEDAYWGSLLSFCEMAAQGVTAFNDMYFFSRDILRAAVQSGMRGLLCRPVVDNGGKGDQMLSEAIELFREFDGKNNIRISLAPHAEYTVSKAMFEKLAQTAKAYGMRVHVHVSETMGEHEDCIKRNGLTPIGLMQETGLLDSPVMAAHCVHVSQEDMDIMAQKGVSVLSCPRSNLKLGSGIARVTELLQKGVNVALGTDGAASNNALSVFGEMTLCALLQKGITGDASAIPAHTALRLATFNGAKALGMDAFCGSLETGKAADIAILDTSGYAFCPGSGALADTVYSADGRDVMMTIANGIIIYEKGAATFADIEEVKAKAREAAQRLI